MLPSVLEGARTQSSCVSISRERESDSEHPMCRKKQWDHDMGQSKGSRRGDNRGKNQKEFKCKYHKCSEFDLGMYLREASAFDASKRGLAETGYVGMASLDLNSLEIGSVLLPERSREIQIGIDSCVAVILFSRVVADDVTRLRTPGDRQVPICVIVVRESENGRDVQSFDSSARDERHEPRYVFLLLEQGYQSVCIPRGLWNENGAGVKQILRFASRAYSAQCSDDWAERQFRFALISFRAGTDRGRDDHDCKF